MTVSLCPPRLLVPDIMTAFEADATDASIALSRTHRAVLRLEGHLQTMADLAAAELTLRQAWDQSARNLISLATTDRGVRLWTRRATDDWWEVSGHGSSGRAWLAHPRTFRLLHRHLCTLVGGRPAYLIDESGSLMVSASQIPDGALLYSSGFPQRAEVWAAAA